jgi:hypothetical protein
MSTVIHGIVVAVGGNGVMVQAPQKRDGSVAVRLPSGIIVAGPAHELELHGARVMANERRAHVLSRTRFRSRAANLQTPQPPPAVLQQGHQ